MGVLETIARIVQLGGGASHAARVAAMRARFEARTGAFRPEDPWFEERSRAFWCDAVTTERFGRVVEAELTDEERAWLGPLERAHRGLFRAAAASLDDGDRRGEQDARVLLDVWSGAELAVTTLDDPSRAELAAASAQLFDARVVGTEDPWEVALVPGAVFHPPDATTAITPVLVAARARSLRTDEALDALLRMERTLRSLSRVKAGYAYRAEALSPTAPVVPVVRRAAKDPK
jgi:hypothetical protein